MKRKFSEYYWKLLGLLLTLAIAHQIQARPQEKVQGDTLVLALIGDLDFFNSVIYQQGEMGYLIDRILPNLTHNSFDCHMQFSPYLATTWQWNDAGTEVIFKLQPGQKWEDGVPVTVDDLLFTFDLIRNPQVNSPRIDHLEQLPGKDAITKIDEHTVCFTFRSAYDRVIQMAHITETNFLPQHILKDQDPAKIRSWEFNRKPLSAGPYTVERWVAGQEIVLTRNNNYTGPPAHLDGLVMRIIPDYTTRLTELQRGNIDMMEQVQFRDLKRLQEHPDLRVIRRGYRFMDYIVWNCKDPLLQDKRIRTALAYAIDYEKLIEGVLSADGELYGKRCAGHITPEICGSQSQNLNLIEYDPEKAKKILAELGWQDTNADGIVERDGRALSFSMLTNSGNPRRLLAGQVVMEMLRKIGVEVKLEQRELANLMTTLRSKDFTAAIIGWASPLWPDPTPVLHSGDEYMFNFGSYANAQVDQLLSQLTQEKDSAKNMQQWHRIQELVYADQPFLYLYWFENPVAIHKRFRQVGSDPYNLLANFEEWWVPKAEQKYKQE